MLTGWTAPKHRIQTRDRLNGEDSGITVEAAIEWTIYHETMLCFTNNIPQRWRNAPAGFRGALTRTINAYAAETGLLKKENIPKR